MQSPYWNPLSGEGLKLHVHTAPCTLARIFFKRTVSLGFGLEI